MAQMNVEKLIKKFDNAVAKKDTNWKQTYREAMDYAAPQRENFDVREKGTRRNRTDIVFDSTAINALQEFVSNIQSSMVPPMKTWIQLAPGDNIPKENKDKAAKILEKVTETMFSAIHNSNFDVQVSEAFTDLGFGTAALMVQKGTQGKPLVFTAIPLSELYVEEGPESTVKTVFRKHKIQNQNVLATFPDAKLGDKLAENAVKKPNEESEFVEVTMPARITQIQVVGDKSVPVEMDGFKYVVVDYTAKEIIVERETAFSPWVVFRWSVMPGETYGRGPVIGALPDIKTLNKVKEFVLKNAALSLAGVYTAVDDGVISLENVQIEPGAVIPVSSNAGGITGRSLDILPTGANFNVAQLIVADLQNAINKALYAEPLGSVDLPVKTATEISMRQQALAKKIGSAFGRLNFEFIVPLVDTILRTLETVEVVTPGEDGSEIVSPLIDLAGLKVDGVNLAIKHISPLATAQDQETLTSILRFSEIVGNATGSPEMTNMYMNMGGFTRKVAELLSVPTGIAATEDEIKDNQKKVAVAAGQQAAAQGVPPQ